MMEYFFDMIKIYVADVNICYAVNSRGIDFQIQLLTLQSR